MTKAITKQDRERWAELCDTVTKHMDGFVKTGEALAEIRDSQLYLIEFKTFEDCVEQKFDLKRSHAYQLITSSQVANALSAMADIEPPKSERAVRPLAKLPEPERNAAWKEATEAAPEGKVTAKVVEAVVARRQGGKDAPPSRSGPPPAIVKPRDAEDNVIPEKFVALFADERLHDIGNRIDQCRRDIEALAESHFAPHLRVQEIASHLRNAKAGVRFAIPYAVTAKHKAGWVPKDVYDRLEA